MKLHNIAFAGYYVEYNTVIQMTSCKLHAFPYTYASWCDSRNRVASLEQRPEINGLILHMFQRNTISIKPISFAHFKTGVVY
jgi:hypothetical protein